MIINYTIGNGYSCNCCRSSHSYQEEFSNWDNESDDQFIKDVIDWCVTKSSCYDWDFTIHDITEWDGDRKELERLIDQAIEIQQQQHKRERLIKSVKENIESYQKWLDDVPSNTLFYQGLLDKAKKELATLTGT